MNIVVSHSGNTKFGLNFEVWCNEYLPVVLSDSLSALLHTQEADMHGFPQAVPLISLCALGSDSGRLQ